MTKSMHLLAAAALAAAFAGPAAGQYPYQQPYPEPYPQPYPPQQYPPQQYPPQQYPYPGYPQNQNSVGQIIDGLLGNRYNPTDRQAIHRCGYAAVERAQAQYGGYANPYGQPGYDREYPRAWQGYDNGYPGYMRVVAIDSVERRSGGLRVRGLIDSGLYRNRNRAAGDLTFRCDVTYNGYVSRIRVERIYDRRY
jgi:hypothetical protein